jgi:hypothetical protein
MSSPPHPPSFNHPNNIRWRIQVMKLIIMQFSPWSIFLPFRPKYLQHSVLKNSQSMFLPQSERPSFAPIQHNWQNYRVLNYINFKYNFCLQMSPFRHAQVPYCNIHSTSCHDLRRIAIPLTWMFFILNAVKCIHMSCMLKWHSSDVPASD